MKKFLSTFLLTVIGLFYSNQAGAVQYFLKSSGSPTVASSWNTKADGTGADAVAFSSANDVWNFQVAGSRTTASIFSGAFAAHPNATIVVSPSFSLTVTGSGQIRSFINASANGTLTIENGLVTKLRILNASSTVIYNSGTATITPVLNGLAFGNVIVAASTRINGTANPIRIGGKLTINSGQTLNLAGFRMILQGSAGTIDGAGTITGTSTSTLELLGGTGGFAGTLNFTPGSNNLKSLRIQFNSGTDYFALGSSLNIVNTGTLAQVSGGIDLNGNTLTVDATSTTSLATSSANGLIRGSSTSGLFVNGPVSGGDIFMHPVFNSLSVLQLNSSGQTLRVGSSLDIIDSISVLNGTLDANGFLTLKSSVAGGAVTSARIGRVGSSAAISNNITVETSIPGGATGWANLGAPGVNGQNVDSWDNYPTNGIPMACVGCMYGPVSGTFHSVQAWSEPTGSFVPAQATTPLTPGQGFWVYVGSGSSVSTDLELVNTGTAVRGIVSRAVTANGPNIGDRAFCLVSNPYASPISWDKVYALNGAGSGIFDAQIQAWSADNGQGSYTAFGGGNNGMTGIIAAGQGFYVRASAAGPGSTIVFDESVKVDVSNAEILRTVATSSREQFRLRIRGAWGSDETTFFIHRSATNNFDRELDADKVFKTAGYAGYSGPYTKYTSISSKDKNGRDYSINGIPPLTQSLSIPIVARGATSGSYTITAKDIENFGSCLILIDKVKGTSHDLRKGAYIFTMSDTTSAPRFELQLCQTEIPAGIEEQNTLSSQHINITRDEQGFYVQTAFPVNTQATISVFNIMGQQLVKDMVVYGTETRTRLNLDQQNQVLIIRVSTEKETLTKKVVLTQ